MTDVDEAELARQMDMLEQENEQVAGDSATDEDDDDDDDEDDNGDSIRSGKKKSNLDDDPKIKAISGLMADADLQGDEGGDDDQNWD